MPSHRFLTGFLSGIFILCILGVAVLTATNLVFGSRDTVKKSLEEGQIYDTVATEIVKAATTHAEQNSEQDIPLKNTVVQGVAKKVITGERIQGYGEQIVDGTYNWLEGQTETPNFAVDASSIKQDLGVAVAAAGVEQVRSLPVCTGEQLQQIDLNNLDLFSLQCLPPGINLEAEQQKLVDKATGSQEILKDTTFSAEDTAAESGEKPFEKVSYLPTMFQWNKFLPWILGAVGVSTGTGIIFLHPDRRQGLKKVSKKFLGSGIILLIVAGVLSLVFGSIRPDPAVQVIELRDSLLIVVTSLASSVTRVLAIFAAIYAIGGGGGLIGLHVLQPKTAPMRGSARTLNLKNKP